jgi:hypothetical protein
MGEYTTDPSVGPPTGRSTGWLVDAGRWEHDTLFRVTERDGRSDNVGHCTVDDRSEGVWPSVDELYRQESRFEGPATGR